MDFIILGERQKTVRGRPKGIPVNEKFLANSFNPSKNLGTSINLSPEEAVGEGEGWTPHSIFNDSLERWPLTAPHILAP